VIHNEQLTYRTPHEALFLVEGEWLERARKAFLESGIDPTPIAHTKLRCPHGLLQYDPSLTLRMQHDLRLDLQSDQCGSRSHSEYARDQQLASAIGVLTRAEVIALMSRSGCENSQGEVDNSLTDPEGLLPKCTLVSAREKSFFNEPPCFKLELDPMVCEDCYRAMSCTTLERLVTFENATIHINFVRERPDGSEGVALASFASKEGAAHGLGTPRRSRRANSGAKLSVNCSSSNTISTLKLLIYQATDKHPNQLVLYLNGRELQPQETLCVAGIIAGSTLQMYVDASMPCDHLDTESAIGEIAGSLEAQSSSRTEDGFAGSTLLGASCAMSKES